MLQAAEPDDFQMNTRVHAKYRTRHHVTNWADYGLFSRLAR